MKRVLILILAAVSAFALVSCNAAESTTLGNSEASAEVDLSNVGETAMDENYTGPVSPTTGMPVSAVEYHPVIVQIDNEASGRPQYGIQAADIVYETMIEGVDTRLTALYNDNLPEQVGPVRSARVYHQQIAAEWDPIFVHQGGPNVKRFAQSYLYTEENGDVFNCRIDGTKSANSDVIWSESVSIAYANPKAAIEEYDFVRTERDPLFAFDIAVDYADAPAVKEIQIPFLSSHDHVTYTYDTASDKFERYRFGEPFIDIGTEEAVTVQNVIVQYCDIASLGSDEGGRITVGIVGEGKAEFYVGGKHLFGTWKKDSVTSGTVYTLDDGTELVLKPGNTWIEVQPASGYVITEYSDGTQYPEASENDD